MANKTCGECRYLDKNRYCEFLDFEPKPQMKGCANFEPKPTNGYVIRQMSNEKLAELFDNSCKVCAKDITECDTDCVAGILAWLNAPAESEGEDD
jgi:hypothetical protein